MRLIIFYFDQYELYLLAHFFYSGPKGRWRHAPCPGTRDVRQGQERWVAVGVGGRRERRRRQGHSARLAEEVAASPSIYGSAPMALPAIAQLVEHLTVECCSNQMVPGSIPGGRIFPKMFDARVCVPEAMFADSIWLGREPFRGYPSISQGRIRSVIIIYFDNCRQDTHASENSNA